MALDGSEWNVTIPVNSTLAFQIDDHIRDIKSGVQGRLAHEHVFPVSQTSTSEAGYHKFITFQAQSASPTLAYGTYTPVGALYVDSANKNLIFKDSADNEYIVMASGVGIAYASTGAQGDVLIGTTSGAIKVLGASTDGYVLKTHSTTGPPTWESDNLDTKVTGQGSPDVVRRGRVTVGGSSTTSVSIGITYADTLYTIALTPWDSAGNENMVIVQKNATTFSFANRSLSTTPVDWLTIGET